MAGKDDSASRLSPLGKPYSDMKHTLNADGQNLYCKYWEPENEPKALVVIVHGLGEHCERYDKIALSLTKHDILVFAHDHVGHGQSEGTRLDVKDFHIFVRDLFQHIDVMKSKHPKLPLFMIGHSMGGTIAVNAAMDRPTDFEGVILIAPGIIPNPVVATPFKGGTIALLAAYERSSLFSGIVLSSPAIDVNSEIATPFKIFMAKMLGSVLPQVSLGKILSSDVSRNPETSKAYDEDPLIYHGGLKARISYQILCGMDRVKTGISDIRWPFLVQHGDRDKLAEISGSKLLYEKAPSQDKTFTIYEGCYHELDKELEEDAARAVSEVEEWIVKHLPEGSGVEVMEPAADEKAIGVEIVGTAEEAQAEASAE